VSAKQSERLIFVGSNTGGTVAIVPSGLVVTRFWKGRDSMTSVFIPAAGRESVDSLLVADESFI
jgi:hypothetical protein